MLHVERFRRDGTGITLSTRRRLRPYGPVLPARRLTKESAELRLKEQRRGIALAKAAAARWGRKE